MVASRILIARMRPSLSHDCCLGGGSLLDLSGASLVPFLGATLVLFSVVFLLALVVITRGFFGFFGTSSQVRRDPGIWRPQGPQGVCQLLWKGKDCS